MNRFFSNWVLGLSLTLNLGLAVIWGLLETPVEESSVDAPVFVAMQKVVYQTVKPSHHVDEVNNVESNPGTSNLDDSKVRLPQEFLGRYVPYRMNSNVANACGPIQMLKEISELASVLGLSDYEQQSLVDRFQEFVDEFKELQRKHVTDIEVSDGKARYIISVPRTKLAGIRRRLEWQLVEQFGNERATPIIALALSGFADPGSPEKFIFETEAVNSDLRAVWTDAESGKPICNKNYIDFRNRTVQFDEEYLFTL